MSPRSAIAILALLAAQAAGAQSREAASATLVTPVKTNNRLVVNGTLWQCSAATCTGPAGNGRFGDHQTCRDLAGKVGRIAAYSSARGTLSDEELQRCNARAKRDR